MKQSNDKCKYYKQALTTSAYANEKDVLGNDAMATIGDALISFIFMDIVKRTLGLPQISKDDISKFKEIIQNNDILDMIGKTLLKDKDITMRTKEEPGRKMYATAIEAYVYAMYLCEEMEATKKYIENDFIKAVKQDNVKLKIYDIFEEKKKNDKNFEYDKLIDLFNEFILKV
jgi:dsRNA-specific ribonuclease